MRKEEARPTIPVSAMDTEEQGVHEYLIILTRPYDQFVLVAAEEEEDDE
jgi:hypothetical protein